MILTTDNRAAKVGLTWSNLIDDIDVFLRCAHPDDLIDDATFEWFLTYLDATLCFAEDFGIIEYDGNLGKLRSLFAEASEAADAMAREELEFL